MIDMMWCNGLEWQIATCCNPDPSRATNSINWKLESFCSTMEVFPPCLCMITSASPKVAID